MTKKLPVLGKPVPANAQTELAAKPVSGGSRPAFPMRNELYRKAGILGGAAAAILAGGIASADAPVPNKKPPPQQQTEKEPAPPAATPDPALANGSVDGKAIDLKKQPTFKVYREGGGIGPAEDMWEPKEVEAFINWTMAKEGKLAIQTGYKFDLDGVSLQLQGFDPAKNVGYAYVDKTEPSDAFTKATVAKIAAWQKAKKVAILLIEVKKTPDQATLKGKVVRFLADVKKAPMTPGVATVTPEAPPPVRTMNPPAPTMQTANPPAPVKAPTKK